MKLASLKLSLVVASAALLLAGCTKKPSRPSPDQTLLGQTPGGGAGNLNTSVTDTTLGANADGLVGRTDGFDANNQNRTALAGSTVYFDYDSSAIKAGEREKLKAAKAYLDAHASHKILLEGHCDWRGTAEYNLALGDRRANAVKKYLTTLGIPADKLETLSKGSLEASKNADDATRAKDRRVDLVVIDPAGGMIAPAAGAVPAAMPAANKPL